MSSYTVVERTVRPGENVTLHCDCKRSPGEMIVWYRNCSHENQPTLILRSWKETRENEDSRSIHPNEMKNRSSQSHALLIRNISDSHLGLYCCGTEKKKICPMEKILLQSMNTDMEMLPQGFHFVS